MNTFFLRIIFIPHQECYERGVGVPRNYQEARRLYQLSASQDPTKTTPYHEALKELNEKIRTECPLLGKQVVITGTSREDLNGKAGVATSFDHVRGRYAVVLYQPGRRGPWR